MLVEIFTACFTFTNRDNTVSAEMMSGTLHEIMQYMEQWKIYDPANEKALTGMSMQFKTVESRR
jgi:hypothetical protein